MPAGPRLLVHGETDNMRRFGVLNRPVYLSRGLSDCSDSVSKVGKTNAAGFRIAKFRHILVCTTTAISRMVEWTTPGDLAYRISLVRTFHEFSDCSGGL